MKAKGDRRALIGNYQKLGLFEPGILSVLSPLRGVALYDYDDTTNVLTAKSVNGDLRDETVAYYQTAAHLYGHNRYRALGDGEQTRLSAEAALKVEAASRRFSETNQSGKMPLPL